MVVFSELYRQSNGLCAWSPSGDLVAVAVGHRVVVRDGDTMKISQLFTANDELQMIQWSPDGEYVMAASYKKGVVNVWSIRDEDWQATVTEGVGGVCHVMWAPDSRHVLTTADFRIYTSVWSLMVNDEDEPESKARGRSGARKNKKKTPKGADAGKCVGHILNPKGPNTTDFDASGRWLAVATREQCKDRLEIYHAGDGDWSLAHHFGLSTHDAANVAWSPRSRFVCVLDCPLQYLVLVFSPDGTLLRRFQPYKDALGVRSVRWDPSGQFLSIGSFDDRLRVLSHMTWKAFADFSHEASLKRRRKPLVFCEVVADLDESETRFGVIAEVGAVGESKAGRDIAAKERKKKEEDSDKGTSSSRGAGVRRQRKKTTAAARRSTIISKRRAPTSRHYSRESDNRKAIAKTADGFEFVATKYVLADITDVDAEATPLRSILPDPKKGNPKMGVAKQEWSRCGRFVATVSSRTPRIVWIWAPHCMSLCAILKQQMPVRSISWDPARPRLAICVGAPKIFFWTPKGASWTDVPAEAFGVLRALWRPSGGGSAILAVGKSKICSLSLDIAASEGEGAGVGEE